MADEAIRTVINGIHCSINFFGSEFSGSEVPLIVMPVADDVSELIEGQHMRLDPAIKSGEESSHVLVTFETNSWNDDLSPWPAPASGRKQKAFGGLADKTLRWIQDDLIPEVTVYVPSAKNGAKGLLGYSMAGLFALWAMCRTDAFSVYASCSGSLWYDGFVEYLKKTSPKTSCCVYLSLGDREEFSRNPLFAGVGNATREIAAYLKTLPVRKQGDGSFASRSTRTVPLLSSQQSSVESYNEVSGISKYV